MVTSEALVTEHFRDLLEALLAEGARFLLVGAHALAVHGVPRMTADLDVWIEPGTENAARVWRALVAFGAPVQALGLDERALAAENIVAQIGVPPSRVDLLTSIDGVTFDAAWDHRTTASFLGLTVPVIGRDDLIRNKRATGRTRDMLDVAELEG